MCYVPCYYFENFVSFVFALCVFPVVVRDLVRLWCLLDVMTFEVSLICHCCYSCGLVSLSWPHLHSPICLE
jgi:hypothetical protein